ncbi:hypothetical protein CH375_22810 [Leptospira ellisii]|nr:hypothetical protein CH375_22810 [Leptospira ellisii]
MSAPVFLRADRKPDPRKRRPILSIPTRRIDRIDKLQPDDSYFLEADWILYSLGVSPVCF